MLIVGLFVEDTF